MRHAKIECEHIRLHVAQHALDRSHLQHADGIVTASGRHAEHKPRSIRIVIHDKEAESPFDAVLAQ